jgi:two-component system sensor histidine kinase TctE
MTDAPSEPAAPPADAAAGRAGAALRRAGSLRAKLLTPLLWLWLGTGLAVALIAFWLAGRAAQLAFDRTLQDDAQALASQVHWTGGRPSFSVDAGTAASIVYDSLAPSRFLVRTTDGRTLVGNASLPLPPRAAAASGGEPVFFDVAGAAAPHRTAALRAVALRLDRAPGPSVWVIVGEPLQARQKIVNELAAAIFLPAAALSFIVVPLLMLGVRRGLAPARDISALVAQRGIDDLSPLPTDDVPDELRGLVGHLNDLLARLQLAIDGQRRFIADAAHQLRTPVAGIKLLAGDLRRTAQADPTQPPDREVVEQLQASALHTAHLVQQLLALARLENAPSDTDALTDVAQIVEQVAGRWQSAAAAAGKRLRIAPATQAAGADSRAGADDPVMVQGNAVLLGEALGNLVDNALQHGGDTVRIEWTRDAAQVRLSVHDDGPGLSAQTRARMLEPFWRGAQAPQGGSGLGLSITQQIVRNVGGTLDAAELPDGAGTRLDMRLPRHRAAR